MNTPPTHVLAVAPGESEATSIQITNFSFYYGLKQALFAISMDIPIHSITAFIGPSGCGKSTLLRNINRMNDHLPAVRHSGTICIAGSDIRAPQQEITTLRKRIGMVFQRSNPFTKSIFENVIFGLRIEGESSRSRLEHACEEALRHAALWDEVKDRLHSSALGLSGGQQQRLCIARAIAINPEILLMDEPCSALDPIATSKIEELILGLKTKFTIVIVTHNMQQAARCSDRTAYFYSGKLIEYSATSALFTNPTQKHTEDYITGRFG